VPRLSRCLQGMWSSSTDRVHEDVVVVRVHDLAPRSVWSKRYEFVNEFEKMLTRNGTTILKFYLHISP
jgi:polyphosphate kinase 2 (PPK2 family)